MRHTHGGGSIQLNTGDTGLASQVGKVNIVGKSDRVVVCGNCNGKAIYMDNAVLYGKSYGKHPYCWFCPKCEWAVGVHKGTDVPLGTLADKATRELRRRVHDLFDPLWRNTLYRRFPDRDHAYEWLAACMELSDAECHVGMFTLAQCEQAIALLLRFRGLGVSDAQPESDWSD